MWNVLISFSSVPFSPTVQLRTRSFPEDPKVPTLCLHCRWILPVPAGHRVVQSCIDTGTEKLVLNSLLGGPGSDYR